MLLFSSHLAAVPPSSSSFCMVLLSSPLAIWAVLLRVVTKTEQIGRSTSFSKAVPFLALLIPRKHVGGDAFLPASGGSSSSSSSPIQVAMVGLLIRFVVPPSSSCFWVVLLSYPSLVWCCFPLLGGVAFSSILFSGALPPSLFWVVVRFLPAPLGLSSLTSLGLCGFLPLPLWTVLLWVVLLSLLLSGGAALHSWVVPPFPRSFIWLPALFLSLAGGAAFPSWWWVWEIHFVIILAFDFAQDWNCPT